jgi:hypothetical protein
MRPFRVGFLSDESDTARARRWRGRVQMDLSVTAWKERELTAYRFRVVKQRFFCVGPFRGTLAARHRDVPTSDNGVKVLRSGFSNQALRHFFLKGGCRDRLCLSVFL